MRRLDSRLRRTVAALILLAACRGAPSEVSETSAMGSSSSGVVTTSSTTGSSSGLDETGIATGSATSSTSGVDGSGIGSSSDDGTTTNGLVATDSGSSDGTTGEPSSIGCADGEREALLDETTYPDIAACGGGFGVPGVGNGITTCGRMGGDDGPIPDGMPCSVDDLCAEGWHLCASRHEVAALGIASCASLPWFMGFFVTAQSGEGSNTCADTGTNDVFGCGDAGYPNINGCTPLNNSTSNECFKLPGPWQCPGPAIEAQTIFKSGPDYGGALCCRD